MSRWFQRLALAGLLLVQTACAPNENSQRSQWEQNQKTTQALAAHYPAAEKVLTARLAEVKVMWDKAAAETDKEKRAEAMKAANDALVDVTGGLTSLENRIDHIEQLKTDRRFKTLPAGRVLPVFNLVDSSVVRVRGLFTAGPIATAEELKARTKAANSEMILAVGNLERLAKLKK
jgi:hypothetical protein